MTLLLKFMANKKLKEIEIAMQSGSVRDLAKAADMDLSDPMFSEMTIDEAFDVITVRLADRLEAIKQIRGVQK